MSIFHSSYQNSNGGFIYHSNTKPNEELPGRIPAEISLSALLALIIVANLTVFFR